MMPQRVTANKKYILCSRRQPSSATEIISFSYCPDFGSVFSQDSLKNAFVVALLDDHA